ncbi:ankyrin repeat-containing domain protein [Terfezia claveryi]|nr:ankyrin repeat-containing domain protein [Terfezia claveryi]
MGSGTVMAEFSPKDITNDIADGATKCAQKFKLVTHHLQALELKSPREKTGMDSSDLDVSSELLKDTWARFNVWTSNIGALQRGKASLDFRLRHADVKEEVLRLLRHLNSTLAQLLDIICGIRQQEVWYSTDEVFKFAGGEFSDMDSDEEDTSGDLQQSPEVSLNSASGVGSEPQRMTESNELALAMGEALRGLFQLSMFIHKSTRQNKFASFAADRGETATQIDIRHVQDRFPFARNNPELIERLGKANRRRRQWLTYKKKHRAKLGRQPSLDPNCESPTKGPRRWSLSLDTGLLLEDYVEKGVDIRSDRSERTGLSSTIASTFYAIPSLEPDEESQGSEAGYSETTYSESVNGGSDIAMSYFPQPPLESANGNPFECPYCFRIVSIIGRTSWAKHVYSDLGSYVCTQTGCSHPPFDSSHQWFEHELEAHRLKWFCGSCSSVLSSAKSFQEHMRQQHPNLLSTSGSGELQALTDRAERPIQQILATECPLCDYDEILKQRRRLSGSELGMAGNSEPITLRLKTFRRHLGRHLEQLALFVLPMNELMEMAQDLAELQVSEKQLQDGEGSDGEGSDGEDHAVLTPEGRGYGTQEEDGHGNAGPAASDSRSLQASTDHQLEFNPKDLQLLASSSSDTRVDIIGIEDAPELAMGWHPPMNFTPPQRDFENEDVDLRARREEPMFGGDLFTPGYVRGYGKDKEGFCGRCEPGVWFNIQDGSYRENLMFKHGIHCSGIPLPRPSNLRKHEGEWQGFCEACQGWRTIRATDKGWNWFRHCNRELVTLRERPSLTTSTQAAEEKQKDLAAIIDLLETEDSETFRFKLQKSRYLGGEVLTRVLIVDLAGWTVLHHLADRGHDHKMDVMMMLVANNQQLRSQLLEARTKRDETALVLAAQQGNVKALKILIDNGANLDTLTKCGETALDCAGAAGFMDICKLLIDSGADIGKSKRFCRLQRLRLQAEQIQQQQASVPQQIEGPKSSAPEECATLTPLMVAAAAGDVAATMKCLRSGVDIEETTEDTGETAFMLAASKGHCEILHILLSSGANIDATNAKGWTTLMLASRSGNLEVVDLLTSRGADVNHASPDRWTALAEATCRGNIPIIIRLLGCKADTETPSMHDWTPLMHAAFRGDLETVSLLLGAGADMDIISPHDETALLLAAAEKHTEICRMLLNAGCDPEPPWVRQYDDVSGETSGGRPASGNADVTLGWTPMMLACQNGLEDVVRMLVDRSVHLGAKSPYGKTALEIAKENGMHTIVEFLAGMKL